MAPPGIRTFERVVSNAWAIAVAGPDTGTTKPSGSVAPTLRPADVNHDRTATRVAGEGPNCGGELAWRQIVVEVGRARRRDGAHCGGDPGRAGQ